MVPERGEVLSTGSLADRLSWPGGSILSMNLLIIEPRFGGHYLEYVRKFLVGIDPQTPIALTLATSPQCGLSAELSGLVAQVQSRFELTVVPTDQLRRCVSSKAPTSGTQIFQSAWQELCAFRRVFREATTNIGVDAVFVPYLDSVWPAIILRPDPFSGTRWFGLTMRRRFHLPRQGVAVRLRAVDHVDEILFRRFLSLPSPGHIGVLEPYLPTYAQAVSGSGPRKVIFVPDPADIISGDREKSRRRLGLRQSDLAVVLFGRIDERKGLPLLHEALTRPDWPAEAVLLLVGLDAGRAERRFRQARAASNREPKIACFDGYQSDQEVADVFAAGDVAWLAYQDHAGPSGLLVQAAKAGLAVLARPYGIIGYEVARYDLGLLVNTAADVVSALNFLITNSGRGREMGARGRTRFADYTTTAYALAVWRGLVGEKEGTQ